MKSSLQQGLTLTLVRSQSVDHKFDQKFQVQAIEKKGNWRMVTSGLRVNSISKKVHLFASLKQKQVSLGVD